MDEIIGRLKGMMSKKFEVAVLTILTVTIYGEEAAIDPEWIAMADTVIALGYMIMNVLQKKWITTK